MARRDIGHAISAMSVDVIGFDDLTDFFSYRNMCRSMGIIAVDDFMSIVPE